MSKDLINDKTTTIVQANDVTCMIKDRVTANDTTVSTADIETPNGVIDAVLFPK